MPRPKDIASPEALDAEGLRPLVGENGPDLSTALFAISTWGNSTRFRELVVAESRFPLPDDLPAFLLVNQLVYRGAARPTDLADAIDTGRSNVSRLVRRLEGAGIVVRIADPVDNRGVVVGLTAEGREVARRIVDATRKINGLDASAWTPEDERDLSRLLVKLASALDANPQRPLTSVSGVKI